MTKKLLYLIALFTILFSNTFCNTTYVTKNIPFEENKTFPDNDAKSFKLSFQNYENLKQYIHITITSNSTTNQLALISDSDPQCKNSRKLMGMKPYEPINLFFKKEEIPSQTKELYLCVSCQKEKSCKYQINLNSVQKCQIKVGSQYSYYVTDKNTQMDFEFLPLNTKDSTGKDFFQFWVKGGKINSTFLGEGHTEKSFSYGKIYSIKNTNSGAKYELKVEAEKGDYINIGSIHINGEISKKQLRINDLEIIGSVSKDLREMCFPIQKRKEIKDENDIIYINGLVFTKKAQTYYKENGVKDQNSIKQITDGIIVQGIYYEDYKSNKTYCISYLDSDKKDSLIFSLQLTSNKYNNYNQIIYPPQIPGVIYPHFLLKGEIAIFQGMKPTKGAAEINYNMKLIMGFPDMRFDKCQTYPDCFYDDKKVETIIDPHHSNRMTVYSFYLKDEKEITPISAFQPLMIVKCEEGKTEREKALGICVFETAIFSNKDRLQLKEAETFSQFLLKGEKDLYKVDFSTEDNVEKVYLDLIIFSGDVRFNMDNSSIDAHKYFLSNKIFYSIKTNNINSKRIDFSVVAEKNSFYIVQYQLVRRGDDSNITNIIESGVNYVESIDISENGPKFKYVELQNLKFNEGGAFLTTFFSKNCKFSISLANNKENPTFVDIYDDFGQLLIEKEDPYYSSKYTFKIQPTDTDISQYNKKLCMIYVSGLELETADTTLASQRSISLSESVPHSFVSYQNYNRISYSYHLSDRNKSVVIDFHLVNKATFKVKILFNEEQYKNLTIYRNKQVFIYSSELKKKCPEDEVCTINIVINLLDNTKAKIIETTVSQVGGAPTYLEKNAIRQDFLIGDKFKYYYLDIGKDEVGDITIDYKRSSGNIYASIVPKMETKEIPGAEWRGIYKFPKNINESLQYEPYLKKINIISENTQKCQDGCYLLIAIKNSYLRNITTKDEKSQLVPFRITILPRIIPYNIDNYRQVPKLRILVNEFIIGNIAPSDKVMYEFYQVWLPYDSDSIVIDWQADKPQLFINVGEERPNTTDYDFKCVRGHDSICIISKEEIMSALQLRNKTVPVSIRYMSFVLGIYTEKIDTLYTSVYAFKIFQPPVYEDETQRFPLELIHVRSDQKVQCVPKFNDEIFSCLFAVIFDESDQDSNLVVYPKSQDETSNIKFMGDLVDAKEIERNNITYIANHMPAINGQFSSTDNRNYIYVEKIDRKKCLLFIVTIDTNSIVEILSSTYKDNYRITPNPSTPQLFMVKENQINFNFVTTQDLLINIVCVSGSGYFYWEEQINKKYYLFEKNDRITLTSATNSVNNKLSNLVAKSDDIIWYKGDNSGFIFYITYYPRNNEYNIDQIKIGRSTEFNYRDIKFPLNFYTPVNNEKDITVSFSFYKFFSKNNIETLKYDRPMFKIWGLIISEDEAYNARYDKTYKPHKDKVVYGNFDGAFGTLFINSDNIKAFNISKGENPTLFFSVENEEGINYDFNGASVEVSVLQDKIDGKKLFVPENVYINGKLENAGLSYFTYKLRTNSDNPYMHIELSYNKGIVKYSIHKEEGSPKNSQITDYLENKISNGKIILIFKVPENKIQANNNCVYLSIFAIENKNFNPNRINYIFKYTNSKDINSFYHYSLKNEKVDYKILENNYILTFHKIEHSDVTFYIKGISKDELVEGELLNSTAISQSEGTYLQVNNPKPNSQDKIELKLENVKKNLIYIKVLAKMNYNTTNIYLLYHPVIINETSSKIEEIKGSNNIIDLDYEANSKQVIKKIINVQNENQNHLQKFKINFKSNNDIPKYIKIETLSEEKPEQIIYLSQGDKRIQLSQKGFGNINYIWIKKEQILNNNNYNINVQCQNKKGEKCNYTIRIIGYDNAEIDTTTFVYNYYVNNDNKEMDFKIKNKYYNEDTILHIMTFYATGSQKINIILNNCTNCYKQYNFRTGVAINIHMPKTKYFNLKVIANEGDYISVGSKITLKDGRSVGNLLRPNNKEITGYLKRGELNSECYLLPDENDNPKIDTYFISGIFYKRIAQIILRDQNYEPLINTTENVNKGFYSYVYNRKKTKGRFFCILFPRSEDYNIEDIPYTLHLYSGEELNSLNAYSPQIPGNIYPRIINKGSFVFFNVAPSNSGSNETIYNMISNEGLPEMYIDNCYTYPLCNLDLNKTNSTDIIKINNINRMSTWINYDQKNSSPIQSHQFIMFVKCVDLKDPNIENCKFQTSILGNNDFLTLIERQSFGQYILKEGSSKLMIDFEYEKITAVLIDIMIVSGDISFSLNNNNTGTNVNCSKYYLANKIFYIININDNKNMSKIIINTKAKLNSYYVIEYKNVIKDYELVLSEVYNGINYLIQIPIPLYNYKYLNIHNAKLLSNNKYLANFYSLNCKFKLIRLVNNTQKEITTNENYGQEIIEEKKDLRYVVHSYQINITEKDISDYDGNMCFLYVSGLELTNPNSLVQKELLISEGIPQKIIFEKGLDKIRYLYLHSDPEKNISIIFNVINIAKYKLDVTCKDEVIIKEEFSVSGTFFIPKENIKNLCNRNELCSIIVELSVERINNDLPPIIETSVRQIKNVPVYLPKGIVKKDFAAGNVWLYLYTDIGLNESGYITINFERGSFNTYAKIVEKNQDTQDKNADWRQFKLPKTKEESLIYDFYSKKLFFSKEDTKKCEKGCYILISIRASVSGNYQDEFRAYPFTISISPTKFENLQQTGRKILIEPDEFIIGCLDRIDKINQKDMYEFYEIIIPYNVEMIEFDWQSDEGILLVNVGKSRPSLNKRDFIFGKERGDSLYKISRDDILEKGKIPSIDKATLTIGVYTEKIDSLIGTVYSFKVHFYQNKKLNIHKVNSDQKTLCLPEKLKEKEYRCLYMITFGKFDFVNDVMIFARSQSKSSKTYMYGQFIKKEIYDTFNTNELEKNIPNEESKYNTKKENTDFIFFTSAEIKSHFYVSVISDTSQIIELFSSFATFDQELSPNPSTMQVFPVKHEKQLKLKFITQKGLLVNIVSIFGEAKFYFVKDPEVKYHLRGRDDRISLAIPSSYEESGTPILIIENRDYEKNKGENKDKKDGQIIEKPVFAFYIEYHLRSSIYNFDEINTGKTAEFAYVKVDFPLYYYSKLKNLENNINVFFIFHNLKLKNKQKREIKINEFNIRGSVINQSDIYNFNSTKISKINNHPISGIYDASLQIGQIFFSSENLKSFGVNEKDKPTLYLEFLKNEKNNFNYDKLSLELSVIEENSEIPVTEKLYQYGKIINPNDTNCYRLKVDNSIGFMRIQFASNSRYIDFAISEEKGSKKNNSYNFTKEEKRGKLFLTFEKPKKDIYLNVFLKENKNNNKLYNYVFKYIISDNITNFFEYPILNNNSKVKLEMSIDEDDKYNLEVKFNKIEKNNIHLLYILKVAKKWELSSEEINCTIALTGSTSIVAYSENPKEDEITMTINDIEKDYSYVEVIAQIIDGPIIEYVAYDPVYAYKGIIKETNKLKKYIRWIIGGVSGIAILFIIFFIFICIIRHKSKDLVEDVNKVSFVSPREKSLNNTESLLEDDNILI